jgi:geranylgeranyl pyrophosphate synthase
VQGAGCGVQGEKIKDQRPKKEARIRQLAETQFRTSGKRFLPCILFLLSSGLNLKIERNYYL